MKDQQLIQTETIESLDQRVQAESMELQQGAICLMWTEITHCYVQKLLDEFAGHCGTSLNKCIRIQNLLGTQYHS